MFNSSFIFNGFKSQDLNLYIMSFGGDSFSQIQLSTREDRKNLSFEVELIYADALGIPKKIDNITRRLIYSKLITEDYKELTLEDYPDITFYARFIPLDSNITARSEGYFKFRIDTNSPDSYSSYKEYFIDNDTEEEKTVVFSSYDNLNIDTIFPIIEMEILDSGIEESYVKSDALEVVFDFKNLKEYELLAVGEKIIVDCETHTIQQTSQNPQVNRIRQWNCFFLELNNIEYLRVSPRTRVKIKYRLKIVS